ncbi:MAG: peptidylprolyl isomerase [Bdellovibrionota bacterium]
MNPSQRNILKFAALALVLSIVIFFAYKMLSKKEEDPAQVTEMSSPSPQASPSATTDAPATPPTYDLTPEASGLSKATVVMKTSKGVIKFKFYTKDAPTTVNRFAELAHSKFYNGLAFHRVVPGFVVQAGDPKSRNKNDPTVGTGGSGQKLKAEFNGRKHERGTVAMARAADPDSADSQFYVTLGKFPHLDNQYTVIGQVVDFGEKQGDKDVLDRIRQWDEITEMHIE